MPGKLARSEDWGRDLKELHVAQLEVARGALDDPDLSPEKRIHKARRTLKRVRSLLRVLKPHLSGDYARRRDNLKEAAASLAGTRDLDVMAATAESLESRAPDRLKSAMTEIATGLRREAEAAHVAETPIGRAAALLDAALEEARALGEPEDGRALFEDELVRAYKAARRAMAVARANVAEDHLHEWRKRVKHQWHLSRFAKGGSDATGKKTVEDLDILGELLGLEHDHAVLAARLIDDPLMAGDGPTADRVHEVIDARRAKLQKKAFKLGAKLYADPPKAFRSRARLG